MHLFKIAAAAACLAMACSAQSSTIQFAAGLPLSESPTEIDRSLSLGLFDSTLGTLTGVSLELLGSSTFSLLVSNLSAQTQQLSLTASTLLSFTSPNTALASLLLAAPLNLEFAAGPLTLAPQQNLFLGPAARSGSASPDAAALLAIADTLTAAGGGSFLLNCSSLTGVVVSSAGPISVPAQITAGCGARVTYTYQPTGTPPAVPVPGTAALAGLGLLALALGRGAQRSRAGRADRGQQA